MEVRLYTALPIFASENRRIKHEEKLDSLISIDDVLWFMDRLAQYKRYRDHAAIVVIDDCEGSSTSCLFLDDSFFA